MDQIQLDQLSLNELRQLKDNIDNAIRAQIRAKMAMKANPSAAAIVARPPVDLERERDAWIAKRSAKSSV